MKQKSFSNRLHGVLCLLLAMLMVIQLAVPGYAAEPQPVQKPKNQFVEIKTEDELVSGATYAIMYDSGLNNSKILYHKDQAAQSDQVGGSVQNSALVFADLNKFPVETQTWILEGNAEDGYTIKSCSGTNMYLNVKAATEDGSKVPVTQEAQRFQVKVLEQGFSIGRQTDNGMLYLYHESTGGKQFSVNAKPVSLKLFKQVTEEKPVEPETTVPETTVPETTVPETTQEPEKPADPLAIPGYTRVTSDKLDATKAYMIVSKGDNGKLYAFYPSAEHQGADPGNAVDPNHSKHGEAGCPEKCFVAELTVSPEGVSTSKGTMDDLLFTLEKVGNSWAVKFANGKYLAMTNRMLADEPVGLHVTANGISITNQFTRTLVLNLTGDPKEFKPGSFKTNF